MQVLKQIPTKHILTKLLCTHVMKLPEIFQDIRILVSDKKENDPYKEEHWELFKEKSTEIGEHAR